MKWPATIDELMNEDIVLSWHAGWRLGQRAGLGHFDKLDRVAFAILAQGVIVGGQIGHDLLVKSECISHGQTEEIAFVLSKRKKGYWLIKTVLKWDVAVANRQAYGQDWRG